MKVLVDKALNKFISRKLLTFLIATGLMCQGSLEKEQEEKQEAARLRSESLARLEKEYEGREDKLSFEKRARYLELLETLSQEPEMVNKAIEEEFGFTYEE